VLVTPADVDGNDLGTYDVTVNRSGLADGVYTAEISITSSVNSLIVQLIMTVGNTAAGGNVGHLYISLVEPDSSTTVFGAQADFSAGGYLWQMTNAPAGNFLIVAGTDTDNDGFICDGGEACGEYITRDQPIIISVDQDLTMLDFPVNYEAQVGTLSVTTEATAGKRGIRRAPDAGPKKQIE